MILSMSFQALLFLLMVVLGMLLGFVYDIIRILRRIINHFWLLVQLEDIIYWIVAAGIVFLIMLDKTYGEIRFFVLLGVFLGMIIYFIALSPIFMGVAMTIVSFIGKLFSRLFRIFMIPVRFFADLLRIPYKFIKKYRLKLKCFIKKVLKRYEKCEKIKLRNVKRTKDRFGRVRLWLKKVRKK